MSERLDRFYVALEERFRGSSALIRERQTAFVPLFKRCQAISRSCHQGQDFPVLDIGCGRGEWLDLLRSNEVPCRGVDMNRDMVSICLHSGHQAICADALSLLASTASESLLGVTAFHVIEHLPPSTAIDLLADIHRCLVPGGLVLFETPNPENIKTATHSFWIDPTHLKPIPPVLLQFMFEFSGFKGNEIVRLNSVESERRRMRFASSASRFMMREFLRAQDYAVVGVKGTPPAGLLPAVAVK